MNTTATLEQLKKMKLKGMFSSYQSQLELPLHQQLDAHELIGHLTQSEFLTRTNERAANYIKMAKLRLLAIPEHVECSVERNLGKEQFALLLEGNYLKQGENILITGATGCGKSFIACALGHQACLQGIKTLYFNMNRFIERLAMSKVDGSYIKLLNQLERTPLIILDDFALQPLTQDVKLAFLQMLEDRYAKKSIIIVSQIPVSGWHSYINEPTVADAILDRLTGKDHRIELKGASRRKRKK